MCTRTAILKRLYRIGGRVLRSLTAGGEKLLWYLVVMIQML